MFRRKIHPRKKTKKTKKHGTWKFLLEKEKTSQSTNLWVPCYSFRGCIASTILEGVLDVSTRSAKRIFPQNLWWLGYDSHRVLLWVGFFFCDASTLMWKCFTSPETNISPWKKRHIPKRKVQRTTIFQVLKTVRFRWDFLTTKIWVLGMPQISESFASQDFYREIISDASKICIDFTSKNTMFFLKWYSWVCDIRIKVLTMFWLFPKTYAGRFFRVRKTLDSQKHGIQRVIEVISTEFSDLLTSC